MIQRLLFISSILLMCGLFISTANVEAQNAARDYVPLTGIYGITQDGGAPVGTQSGNLSGFFQNIFNLLIGIAGILAVIMLTWGGVEYMASDVITKKEDAKAKIQGAALGLLLVLFSVAILYSINPDILSLRVFIPPLTPTTSAPAPAAPTRESSTISTDATKASSEVNSAAQACSAQGKVFRLQGNQAFCDDKSVAKPSVETYADTSSLIIQANLSRKSGANEFYYVGLKETPYKDCPKNLQSGPVSFSIASINSPKSNCPWEGVVYCCEYRKNTK